MRRGAPQRNGNNNSQENEESTIRTLSVEERSLNVVGLGNPAYIAEIRQQLAERRKLLGLYAATKTEVTGKDGSPFIPVEKMTTEEIKAEIERIQNSMTH